jgi:hypothetical protein
MRQNSRTAACECASEVVADLRAFVNHDVRMQHRIASDADAFADGHKRPDGAVFALRRGRLIEKAQSPREIEVGILRNQAGKTGNRFSRQDGAGAGMLHLGRVLGVGQEGKLARPSVLHAGHSGDVDVPLALQTAPQPFGNLNQFHDVVGITSSVPRAVR